MSSTPWIHTPLIESPALSKAAHCKIHLKVETVQPGRSFKSRGVGNFLLSRVREHTGPGEVHFYCSSGGNAGIAAVRAAASLGHPCTVVVPLSAKPRMIDLVRDSGARDVVQFGASWRECDQHLREKLLANDPNGVYVPPFDHPDVWAGNATLIDEIYEQWKTVSATSRPKPAAIVCSVGGGGLFNGVVDGLIKHGWSDVPVLAMETAGADSLNKALEAGSLVTLDAITSQAKSLGATRVSARTFELARDMKNVKSVVLTDDEAAFGCVKLAQLDHMMVELSCGVNVAVCFGQRLEKALGRPVSPSDEVVVVVCGGNDVTIDDLAEWQKNVKE